MGVLNQEQASYGKEQVGKKRGKQKAKAKYHILSKGKGVDITFLTLLYLLLTIGLIMLFSASYANAYFQHGNSFHFISRQFVFAVAGAIAMYFASLVDYRIFAKFANPLLVVSILLLLFVFTQKELNDARRWIFIGDVLNFQPSEVAKFALIVYFSKHMTQHQDKMHDFRVGVVHPMMVLGIIAVLLILEPHLSGTVLMIGIAGVMMIVGGTSLSQLGILAVVGGISLPALIFLLGKWDRLMVRVNYWLDPFSAPRGAGYQVIQSLYAIGSGGLMGVGIGNSRQKYLYLPEPQNDFIFAIVCEEVGFVGATFILLLFALLIWRGFVIALRCKDRFGTLLAVGLITQIGLQVILNVAVVTNTVPNTGIGLPFFSYGGTSLLMIMGQMGILLGISRHGSNDSK